MGFSPYGLAKFNRGYSQMSTDALEITSSGCNDYIHGTLDEVPHLALLCEAWGAKN